MLLQYVRLAFRTFYKNKVAFFINWLGMSIALGCCITAWVNYEYNDAFDSQQVHADRLYRIAFWQDTEQGKVPYGVCPLPVANLVRPTLLPGDEVVQYISKDGQFRVGDEMFQKQFVYAEPVFTKLFTFHLLSGSLSLEDKTRVLISDELARTYYNRTDVVGFPLTQIISGKPKEFTVGGVYEEFPSNSSFRFDLITHYANYFEGAEQQREAESNWARWATTFLFLNNPASATSIEKQLATFVERQNEARPDLKAESFYIEPFAGMSARAVRSRNQGHWMNMPMPLAAVIAPFTMAGFLLLVACFNFTNNSISVAGTRLKEIGIRKVVGGRRYELIVQFLAETLTFCLLTLGFAMVLAEYFTDGWNGMWRGIEITIHYQDNYSFVLVLGLLTLITAILAGAYPAFFISAFRPIQILRGTTRFGGANMLTKGLLVFQFSISLAAVIFALAFYFNSKFQKEYDLGYSWRSVVQVPLDNSQQYEVLRHEIESNPLVRKVGGTEHHIYSGSYKVAARLESGMEKQIDLLNVGDGYFETVNVRLLQGREFAEDQASDVKESLIVNEEFLRTFDLKDQPLGTRVLLSDSIPVYIVGVVKDVYLGALFQPLSAVAFRYVPEENYRYLVASTDPENLAELNSDMKQAWSKLFPAQLYTGRLMEDRMVMALEHFDSVVILYTFLGLVAIILSVSGLYTLVSLNLQRRTKEFGIRKVLGAPLPHLVVQSTKLFLIIMILSFVMGTLLGTTLVNAMMGSVWEYYEKVDVPLVVMAILILTSIALITIGAKIRSVIRSKPVESLRYE